jgi:hypothetical protein
VAAAVHEKFVRALEQDDADYELADVLEASTGPAQQRGTAGLVNKLKARETTARVLPDTQLPEDEAAARIQQQAADRHQRSRRRRFMNSADRIFPTE